ncbi:MAG: hypothetical protein ACXABY_23165 [Candidatus Thorarchaeota archaeon]|jgi:hypothetical protein
MSPEPFDIYEYRAALLEWHQENVGQTQRIYLATDSSTLLQHMAEDILRYANLLSNRYATDIDAADLSVIQRHFSAGDSPETVWHHQQIQQLLRDLIREKQDSLAQYGRYQSILDVWYDLLEWVNDLLPGQNHVIISIEDSIPNFVHRLFDKYFDRESTYQRDQSQQDVAWLGKLALLHLGSTWWEQPDGLHFLYQVVEEHNELFGFY